MFTLKNIILPALMAVLTVTSLQAQEKPNVVVIIVDDSWICGHVVSTSSSGRCETL